MPADNQLTRGRAITLGIVCIACGVPPVLGSLRVIPLTPDAGVPVWVGVAAGSVFLLAAVLLFVDAAAGGTSSDGSLPETAPPILRSIQSLTGMAIAVVLGAVASWIAFGKGERHFSSTISLPFIAYHSRSSDLPGRIAFGIGAVIVWIVVIGASAVAIKKHLARLRTAAL